MSYRQAPLDQDARARLHFSTLSHEEQRAAIRRLADAGQGVYTIAAATGLSVEALQRVLAEPIGPHDIPGFPTTTPERT